MGQYLPSVIRPLVSERATGALSLRHLIKDQTSTVWLKDGRIVEYELDGEKGMNAARQLIGWLTFDSRFSEQDPPSRKTTREVSTAGFLKMSEYIEAAAAKIKFALPEGETRCRFDPEAVEDMVELKSRELRLIASLDGQRTVSDLVRESPVSEYETLCLIYHYYKRGWLRLTEEVAVECEDMIAAFSSSARKALAEKIGPVAKIVWEEALEKSRFFSGQSDVDRIFTIVENIVDQLEENERSKFESWVSTWLKKRFN